MADRFLAARLSAAAIAGLMVLGACAPGQTSSPAVQGTTGADPALVNRAAIMGRTILEGAALGYAAEAVGNQVYGTPLFGVAVSTTAGAVTGTYLGYLQQQFATQELILNQVRSDLDNNSAEIAATINVMRGVLAVQQADLQSLRSQAETGAATPERVNAVVSTAQANLTAMQAAINGATFRQTEFASARNLLPAGNGSQIDPDLAALSNQIAEMRAIANDLAENL